MGATTEPTCRSSATGDEGARRAAAHTDLILRSALLRASRRMAEGDSRASHGSRRPLRGLLTMRISTSSSMRVQLEPLELSVQRGAADAEGLGGRRDIAARAQERPLQHCALTAGKMIARGIARREDRRRASVAMPGRATIPSSARATGSRRSRDRPRRPQRGRRTGRPHLASGRCGAWAKALRNRSASIRLAASPAASAIRLETRRCGRRGRRRRRARRLTQPHGCRSEPRCSSEACYG